MLERVAEVYAERLEVVDEAGGRRLEAGYLQQLRDVTGLGCGGAEFVAAVAAYASGG